MCLDKWQKKMKIIHHSEIDLIYILVLFPSKLFSPFWLLHLKLFYSFV